MTCVIKLGLIVRKFKSRHFRRQCENNVNNAMRSLQSGKFDGVDDIYSNNRKNGSHHFVECSLYLFNSIMSHGCIPESFLFATVLPLPNISKLDIYSYIYNFIC